MFIKKSVLRAAGASLAAVALLAAQPLRAESSSDTARLERLERAVELLQKQNAELRAEVSSLKNVCRESCRRRKSAGLCAAAGTGIEAGAWRIHSDEFRRRRCLRV